MSSGNLTLTRKSREGIRIGDQIEVFVEILDGRTVRLSTLAPKDLKIDRLNKNGEVVKKSLTHGGYRAKM